ncbi:hypothetical protein CBM2600_B10570 [Cupriavidus taiwanensis]|nr:hypothetical protein CBM2600_B10570 [Cupriavidus taiwanensis]
MNGRVAGVQNRARVKRAGYAGGSLPQMLTMNCAFLRFGPSPMLKTLCLDETARGLEVDCVTDNLAHRQNQRPSVITAPLHSVVKRFKCVAIWEDLQCAALDERLSPQSRNESET